MPTTIFNSTVSNSLYSTTSGSALTGQPDNTKTRAIGGTFSNDNGTVFGAGVESNEAKNGLNRSVFDLRVRETVYISSAQVNSSDANYALDGLTPAYIKKGDFVIVNGALVKVTLVGTTDIHLAYDSNLFSQNEMENAATIKTIYQNDVAAARDSYVALGFGKIREATNDAILGGATSPNRDVNNSEVVRSVKIGTAVRSGWNATNATFTTPPTTTNDTSVIKPAVDTAHSGTGKVTYFQGTKPTGINY